MKIIFLGAPGAGKGTQAEVVSKRFAIPAISTGAIIRAAIAMKTPTGVKAKEFIEKGNLVPDEVVIDIVKERLAESDCENGFILDGFPRTVPQAIALENMGIAIDAVVSLEVPSEAIVERMSGRRVCNRCGASYHVQYNPSKDGVHCDNCGEALATRADDEPSVVLSRLEVYHTSTEPLKSFYEDRGLLKLVDGQGSVETITDRTLKALGV
ncbi:MAG: adenylate kinase [Clostridia bacterium]|nr:adenylate kinase [Clostridia bacterium]